MGRPVGTRVFEIEGKKVFAHPVKRDGIARWMAKGGVDVTEKVKDQAQEQPQVQSQAAAPAKQGKPEVSAAPSPQAPAPEAAPGPLAEVSGGEGEEGDENEDGARKTVISELDAELQRANSNLQVIKEAMKGVEVHLYAIKKKLHETDVNRELVIEAERRRLGKLGPAAQAKIGSERLAIRKQTEQKG
jgi:hypothetical protein